MQIKGLQRAYDSVCIVCVHSIETQQPVNDDASLSRHTKRLQEELGKTTPDLTVIKDLMDAEFFPRRKWISKLDVGTRIRETKAKYHVLGAGDQVLK